MTHLTPFPSADPTVVGVAAAARAGNVDAVRVAADRFRDEDREDDACQLDILAMEMEMRCAQARQLRAVLSRIAGVKPHPHAYKPGLLHVREFMADHGLILDAGVVAPNKALKSAFVILMPTDGREVGETVNRLGRVLGEAFPESMFLIYSANFALSEAGKEAEEMLAAEEKEQEQRGKGANKTRRRA